MTSITGSGATPKGDARPLTDLLGGKSQSSVSPNTNENQGPDGRKSPVQFRPYQKAAIRAVHEYWHDGRDNALVTMATGTGKSLIIASLATNAALDDARTLVVSHSREIIDQDRLAVERDWPWDYGAPIGINSEALGERNTTADIVLATVQSIFRHPHALGHRDLLLIDEAHLVPHGDDGMYHQTIAALRSINPDIRIAGFTATPYRVDCGRLDEGDDRLFDNTAFDYGIREGIADGYLSPLVSKAPRAQIDTAGVGRRGGEFVEGQLARAAMQDGLVARSVNEIIARSSGRKSWLIFCSSVEHAEAVRDELIQHGIAAESIVGNTASDVRKHIISDFKAGRITAITNCNVLTTGFDAPNVDMIAMLRPTLSTNLYVQMVGRGTRKAEGKENCLVLDFGGNVLRHGPVDDVEPFHCDNDNRSRNGTNLRICPQCDTINRAGAPICVDCGFRWPTREVKHEVAPLSAPIVSTAILDWFDVERITGRIHTSREGRDSLRINYHVRGLQYPISEWLSFASESARYHAQKKWRRNGGLSPFRGGWV